MSGPRLYHLEGVSKSYEGRQVLHIERLEVLGGETLCLAGPTGAGKSTLLRLLAALEPPRRILAYRVGGQRTRVPIHVERHRDVDADRLLKRDDVLGCEMMFAPVDVRAKAHAVVVEDAARLQAEDLKTAAVGKDGPLPAHERVQSPRRNDRLEAGSQP